MRRRRCSDAVGARRYGMIAGIHTIGCGPPTGSGWAGLGGTVVRVAAASWFGVVPGRSMCGVVGESRVSGAAMGPILWALAILVEGRADMRHVWNLAGFVVAVAMLNMPT